MHERKKYRAEDERITGAYPEFQAGGGGILRKFAPSGVRRDIFWGISPINLIFSNFRGGARVGCAVPPPPPESAPGL